MLHFVMIFENTLLEIKYPVLKGTGSGVTLFWIPALLFPTVYNPGQATELSCLGFLYLWNGHYKNSTYFQGDCEIHMRCKYMWGSKWQMASAQSMYASCYVINIQPIP